MQLKELLSFQQLPEQNPDKSAQDPDQQKLPCMKFHFGDGAFLVAIDLVKEIIENHQIIPYPESNQNHIGLVNLRGQIFPVVRPAFYMNFHSQKVDRLMVIELAEKRILCIQVTRIQKVNISKDQLTRRVINIDDIPVKVLAEQDFKLMDEQDESSCENQAV